jgi:type II secretory pathway pseudopilin PulG
MISPGLRPRSGITLTEILIAILIMGVGLISLATLFPLGLLRLREASRYGRSALAFETMADDMDSRALFAKPTFTQTWYWTVVPVGGNNTIVPRDPFTQDVGSNGNIGSGPANGGIVSSNPLSINSAGLSNGLPFAYDPLWRSLTGVVPNTALADPTLYFSLSNPAGPGLTTAVNPYTPNEARFGAGVFNNSVYPYLRTDPDGGIPSAYGLQRLTNFIPWVASANFLNTQFPFTCQNLSLTILQQPPDVAGNVFTSIDDIVFNPTGGAGNNFSSVLPDMSAGGGPQADYRFTLFVTGRQTDAGGNGDQFTGEIVVCDGRPFGFDLLPGQAVQAPAGETVVEAIFGFGTSVKDIGNGTGFANGSDRSVLLRWKSTLPDPSIKVGGWICDVTYERNLAVFGARSNTALTPFVRCYWYQIGKRTDAQVDTLIPNSGYRSMVLTLTSPVRAKTLLNVNNALPVHLNVALVMPSVVAVIPRAFEVHY